MKGRSSLVLIAAVTLGLILALYGVGGAASTQAVTVRANVRPAAGLQMVNTLDFGDVDPDGTGGGALFAGNDYSGTAIDGAEYTLSVTPRVRANRPWNLQVYADTDLTGAATTIPNGQLAVSGGDLVDEVFGIGAGAAKNIFGASQPKSPSPPGSPWIDVPLTYKLLVSWSDEPDLYSATHRYEAITP